MDQTSHNSSDVAVNIEENEETGYHENNKDSETALVPWMIPRPSLLRNEIIREVTVDNLLRHSTVYPSNLFLTLPSSPADKNKSFSSSTSSSSNTSSKSTNSQTLLLTVANLAAFNFDPVKPHHEYVTPNSKPYDTESLASSTHFTLVNGMERKIPKHLKPVECCCERHQLSILIISMTLFLAATIFMCIYFVHPRTRADVYWS